MTRSSGSDSSRLPKARGVAVILLGLLLAAACGGDAGVWSSRVQRTVKVALVDIFSGAAGPSGRSVRNSLQVQVDELNSRGGLLGNRVEVVAADDEHSPAKAAELIRQQLLDSDVKLLVGPNATASFLAVKARLNQGGVPNCVTTVSDEAMAGASVSFRTEAPDRNRIAVLLDQVRRTKPDVKKIGLVEAGEEAAQARGRQIGDQAGRYGLSYVGQVTVGGDPDHKAPVQQLAAQGAQAIVLSDQAAIAARSAIAVKELGAKLQLLGLAGLASYEFPGVAGDASVGTTFASSIQSYLTDAPDSTWPRGYRTFVQKVTSRYGYASNGAEMLGTPAAADCIVQWAMAVERAGTFRGKEVSRAWETLDIPAADTVQGAPERLSASDHSSVPPEGVFVYSWAKEGSRFRLKQVSG